MISMCSAVLEFAPLILPAVPYQGEQLLMPYTIASWVPDAQNGASEQGVWPMVWSHYAEDSPAAPADEVSAGAKKRWRRRGGARHGKGSREPAMVATVESNQLAQSEWQEQVDTRGPWITTITFFQNGEMWPVPVYQGLAPCEALLLPAEHYPPYQGPPSSVLVAEAPASGAKVPSPTSKSAPAIPAKVGLQVKESAPTQPRNSWHRAGLPRKLRAVPEQELGAPEETTNFNYDEDPLELASNAELSSKVIERLTPDSPGSQTTLMWLLPAVPKLSLSKHGTKVVQQALVIATGELRTLLLRELEPHVVDLYESAYGNYVLTKAIEVMPQTRLGGVISKLQQKGWEEVSKHRFGCRVLERLIEHCKETELSGLIEQVLEKADALSRHPFGNFVVQHLLEHTPECRSELLKCLLGNVSQLAMHRTASHVVQQAITCCLEDDQNLIVDALLAAASPSIAEVACGRYGSFVVDQLAGLGGQQVAGLKLRLQNNLQQLGTTQFGCRVAQTFELSVVPTWTEKVTDEPTP